MLGVGKRRAFDTPDRLHMVLYLHWDLSVFGLLAQSEDYGIRAICLLPGVLVDLILRDPARSPVGHLSGAECACSWLTNPKRHDIC